MGMIAIGICALLVGAILARRYFVIVLAPLSFVFVVLVAAWGSMHGSGFAGVAVAAVLILSLLDLGYLLGYYIWRSGYLARGLSASDAREPPDAFVRPPVGGPRLF